MTSIEDKHMQEERSDSPEPSLVSMKSDQSMGEILNFREDNSSAELRSDPPKPSDASMTSDQSMGGILNSREDNSSAELRLVQSKRPKPSHVSMKSHQSKGEILNFREDNGSFELRIQKESSELSRKKSLYKELEHKVISLVKGQLKKFIKLLSLDDTECPERAEEDKEDQSSVREWALNITLHVLRNMDQTDLANTLQAKLAPSCHQKLKSKLKDNFQQINEGIVNNRTSVLLNEIYTELYITEGGRGEVNKEHEIRQIETASRRTEVQETPIKCNNLFKDKSIRTVLTKGVAGIGKTVSVQKFILDWAEGKANQDIHFIFPLPFRELNLMKGKKYSVLNLLHNFFTNIKELRPRDFYHYNILFIFDGLDECRLPLDFQNNESLCDVTQSATVDVLLTNLIKGNLLPSALVWITSRQAAADQIPPDCTDLVTEVRGFSDLQKEEYFRKRINEPNLAERIIAHMKSSRSLHIMCHIPVFCWIAATVLAKMLEGAQSDEIPKTLTQMFTHFIVFQIKQSRQKYGEKSDIDPEQVRKSILALGKLAFQQLEKGNLIFYEEDLRVCGIDVREVSVYSGVCTQIFREEFGLRLGKVFSFVHLSVQEFLAALYAFLSFIFSDRNVLLSQSGFLFFFMRSTMSEFLKSAVDKALQSKNGHLDLFLRFLLGLSLESNQTILRGLLPQTRSNSACKDETVRYIKEKIKENQCPDKTISLFHCLNELNDHSLVHEVQTYLNRAGFSGLSGFKLCPAQWSAVAFVILNSEEELDKFDLRKCYPSEEGLLRLLPVVRASKRVMLRECNLTERSCEILASALCSNSSCVRELNLSRNGLKDSGVKLLSAGLENPLCKLKKLRLECCCFGEKGCTALVSALKSNPSQLRELSLNFNQIGDSGVKLICVLLGNQRCKLEKLQLRKCNVTEKSCKALALALCSSSSCLKELNLSENKLQDSGVKLLLAGLENSHCKLKKLGLFNCSITNEGCSVLVSALKSNSSHLQELNVKNNKLDELAVKQLSALQEDPHCKLMILHM